MIETVEKLPLFLSQLIWYDDSGGKNEK